MLIDTRAKRTFLGCFCSHPVHDSLHIETTKGRKGTANRKIETTKGRKSCEKQKKRIAKGQKRRTHQCVSATFQSHHCPIRASIAPLFHSLRRVADRVIILHLQADELLFELLRELLRAGTAINVVHLRRVFLQIIKFPAIDVVVKMHQ